MAQTKDGFYKQVDSKTGDNKYVLLGAGGHKEWSELASNSTLASRTSSGDIYANLFNTVSSDMQTTPFNKVYVSNDSFIKYVGLENFAANLKWANQSVSSISNTETTPQFGRIGVGGAVNNSYRIYSNGSQLLNGNLYILTGNTDNFIQFSYDTDNYAGASWRLISKGSGSGDAKYFDIETGGSTTSSTTWNRVIRLTMDNRRVGIDIDSPSYKLHINNGILGITNNSNTITIGSENAQFTHIKNSANIPFSFNNSIIVDGNLYPSATNTKTLGTSSYRWQASYIGTSDSYGSDTQPIYWNNGVPTPIAYSLSASTYEGIANRMAFYETSTTIKSASSIYSDGNTLSIGLLSAPANNAKLQVKGNSILQDIYPESTDNFNIGTTSLRFKNTYTTEEFIGSDSGSQCHLKYDTTDNSFNFIFD